jgi:hypothetical protein
MSDTGPAKLKAYADIPSSPREIRQRCTQVQASWTPPEEYARLIMPRTVLPCVYAEAIFCGQPSDTTEC